MAYVPGYEQRVADCLPKIGVVPSVPTPCEAPMGVGSSKSTIERATTNTTYVPPVAQLATKRARDANIPRIDFADIENAKTPEARKAEIVKFGDALKNRGFIRVAAPDVKPMLPEVNRIMKEYFRQPLEKKMKDVHNNDYETGYAPLGTETAAGEKIADYKETYFIPPHFDKWPAELKDFQKIMEPYHDKLRDYSAKVVGYIFEYLEIKTEEGGADPVKSTASAHNLLRLAHYFAKKPGEENVPIWTKQHTDLNFVTWLPSPEVPGLRMVEDGQELAVSAEEGELILNGGDVLENLTMRMLRAGPHLVRNPADLDPKYEFSDRFASIFFASLSSDYDVSPHPKCVEIMTRGMSDDDKKKELLKFAWCTNLQKLLARLIEMNNKKDYTREMIAEFVSCNLLTQPTEELKVRFPDLFKEPRPVPVKLVQRYPELFPEEAKKLGIATA